MKSYGMIMNIHMKPLQQYYILYAALIFESVNEILWCDHSYETSSAILNLVYAALIFESVDEILWCDHSNETS